MSLDEYKEFLAQQESKLHQFTFSCFPEAYPPDLRDRYVRILQAIGALKTIIAQMEKPS